MTGFCYDGAKGQAMHLPQRLALTAVDLQIRTTDSPGAFCQEMSEFTFLQGSNKKRRNDRDGRLSSTICKMRVTSSVCL